MGFVRQLKGSVKYGAGCADNFTHGTVFELQTILWHFVSHSKSLEKGRD